MGTAEKVILLFTALVTLGAVVWLIYVLWAERQRQKEAERAEREWREAMAALYAAAGLDPEGNEPKPEAEPQAEQKPPKPPKPKPTPFKMDRQRVKKPRPIVYDFPERGKDNERGRD